MWWVVDADTGQVLGGGYVTADEACAGMRGSVVEAGRRAAGDPDVCLSCVVVDGAGEVAGWFWGVPPGYA